MSPEIEKSAIEIVKTLKNNGYKAYIAGGAVRDMLMGIKPFDYDIATDASPAYIEKIFGRVITVGKEFGVSKIIYGENIYDVAQFRTDGKYIDGRRPENISPSDEFGDVKRRDFTINAMLFDPIENNLIDIVGGKRDIEKKIIRTVGDPFKRFSEDYLRMLRAVRLAARFGFTMEPSALSAINRMAAKINCISNERIGEELLKMFTGNNPAIALELCDKSGLLEQVLPEISALKGIEQNTAFHPEGDVFVHTKKMMEIFGGGSGTLAFGILLHDCGKPSTIEKNGGIHFYLHQEKGAEIAEIVLQRLRFSKQFIGKVKSLVKNHMRFTEAMKMRKATLLKLVAMDDFGELFELYRLDCLASSGYLDTYNFIVNFIAEETDSLNGNKLPESILKGDDLISLGYKPGPYFKIILQRVHEAQIENEIEPNFESAADFVKRFYPPDELNLQNPMRKKSPQD